MGWWWFQGGLFAANWNPSGSTPLTAVSGALTIMFWAFTGVESAAVATNIVANPSRNVPRATLLGVALSACIYVGSTAVIFGLAPAEQIAESPAPFETAIAAAIGAGPALVMAFCAMVKAAGALGGWTLLTAESARAAAEDGLFARVFARVDRRGVPVLGLVVVGILMTAMEVLALAPSLGGLFGRLVSMSTLLIIPAYLCFVGRIVTRRDGEPIYAADWCGGGGRLHWRSRGCIGVRRAACIAACTRDRTAIGTEPAGRGAASG